MDGEHHPVACRSTACEGAPEMKVPGDADAGDAGSRSLWRAIDGGLRRGVLRPHPNHAPCRSGLHARRSWSACARGAAATPGFAGMDGSVRATTPDSKAGLPAQRSLPNREPLRRRHVRSSAARARKAATCAPAGGNTSSRGDSGYVRTARLRLVVAADETAASWSRPLAGLIATDGHIRRSPRGRHARFSQGVTCTQGQVSPARPRASATHDVRLRRVSRLLKATAANCSGRHRMAAPTRRTAECCTRSAMKQEAPTALTASLHPQRRTDRRVAGDVDQARAPTPAQAATRLPRRRAFTRAPPRQVACRTPSSFDGRGGRAQAAARASPIR